MLPDQLHLNHVATALWHGPPGNASVMVGAGLSCNALKIGPHLHDYPLWKDFAGHLSSRLYPTPQDRSLSNSPSIPPGGGEFLRLAQEYEEAFGRGALDKAVREVIPDALYAPGELHERLLRLPWRDVFTTNWDTLLERTPVQNIHGECYVPVRCIAELPLSAPPRIVKLHGTVPDHPPFICTEEDYRIYPHRFAPFVNTMQQAMLETTVLLLGFSGDDPNFLHWTGWVRDNLGPCMPRIYLAGWLDVSPPRRRLLERRNIVPIDLSRHSRAGQWPEHQRHRHAMEWVLSSLEQGKPYSPWLWPVPCRNHAAPVPEYLRPVRTDAAPSPRAVPSPPDMFAKNERVTLAKQVQDVVLLWKHNRLLYPGWLFLPPEKQLPIFLKLREWIPHVLRILPDLPTQEQLAALHEIVWLGEQLLVPPDRALCEAVDAVLNAVDCHGRRVGEREDRSLPWAEIREQWRCLALARLTAYRYALDRTAFDATVSALEPFMADHPDVAQRVVHEKCLFALNNHDYPELLELLRQWTPGAHDPAWLVRKAALLAEVDMISEAAHVLHGARTQLAQNFGRDNATAVASREAWALWMGLALEYADGMTTGQPPMNTQDIFAKWNRLASLHCDAFAQRKAILESLAPVEDLCDDPLFDLNVRRIRTTWSAMNTPFHRQHTAWQAVRMTEVAGLPVAACSVALGSEILARAAKILAPTAPALAARLVLRTATTENDPVLAKIWSRQRLAALRQEDIQDLLEVVNRVLDQWLRNATHDPRMPAPDDDLLREIGVIIAVRRKAALDLALQLAQWIFQHGTQPQQENMARFALHGLGLLMHELDYQGTDQTKFGCAMPLYRMRCVLLALAMSEAGYAREDAVEKWVAIRENDPLPEMRQAAIPGCEAYCA